MDRKLPNLHFWSTLVISELKTSSDEIGIKSGQDIKADLDGEGACDLTLMGTSGGKFPDVEEEAVRSITDVASRIIG